MHDETDEERREYSKRGAAAMHAQPYGKRDHYERKVDIRAQFEREERERRREHVRG